MYFLTILGIISFVLFILSWAIKYRRHTLDKATYVGLFTLLVLSLSILYWTISP